MVKAPPVRLRTARVGRSRLRIAGAVMGAGTITATAALLSCGGSPLGHDLVVTSYSPKAEAEDASSIDVKFNRPVVSASCARSSTSSRAARSA